MVAADPTLCGCGYNGHGTRERVNGKIAYVGSLLASMVGNSFFSTRKNLSL